MIKQIIQEKGLSANQSDPASLKIISQELQARGVNANVDVTDQNGHTGGITVDGHPYQLINGSNQWTDLQAWPTEQQNAQSQGQQGGVAGQALGDYHNLMNQYQQWANTGGYSPEDLANIRARAVSPIRSVYSTALQGVERNKALQGGYAPNYDAAMAKLAREQSFATNQGSTNAEGMIAQMVNQGKQFGMGGMSGMYGQTPGLANMFGNQMLAGQNNLLQAGGLQNQLGLGIMGAQNQKGANVAGNTQQVIGNIGGIAKIGGGIAGGF